MGNLKLHLRQWHWPGLLAVLLLLLAARQWLALDELGHRWRGLPYETSASALADFAELQALRSLSAEDSDAQQQLVTELSRSPLVLSARLYDGGGRLLADNNNGDNDDARVYVRPLYEQERIAGFLQLSLAGSALSGEHQTIWQGVYRHLGWLLPLTGALGALLSCALLRLRRLH